MLKQNVDINSLISSADEVSDLVMKLENLQAALYSAKGDLFRTLMNSPHYSSLAAYLAAVSDVTYEDKKALSSALKDIRSQVMDLPRIKVALPSVDFSPESWSAIFGSLKKNLMGGMPFLAEVEVDSHMLGGIVINWQGSYIDLSLRKNLSKFLTREVDNVFK